MRVEDRAWHVHRMDDGLPPEKVISAFFSCVDPNVVLAYNKGCQRLFSFSLLCCPLHDTPSLITAVRTEWPCKCNEEMDTCAGK